MENIRNMSFNEFAANYKTSEQKATETRKQQFANYQNELKQAVQSLAEQKEGSSETILQLLNKQIDLD